MEERASAGAARAKERASGPLLARAPPPPYALPMPPRDPAALLRRINTYPPYVGARIQVTELDPEYRRIRVEMRLEEANANLVGVHFGGSLYAMVDPHLMILLMERLGDDYLVWDKRAEIDFVKPGTGTVHATLELSDDEVEAVRAAADEKRKHLPEWTVEVLDEEDEVVARVKKTLYVRRKR